jgi:hypothetical protein
VSFKPRGGVGGRCRGLAATAGARKLGTEAGGTRWARRSGRAPRGGPVWLPPKGSGGAGEPGDRPDSEDDEVTCREQGVAGVGDGNGRPGGRRAGSAAVRCALAIPVESMYYPL